jgi:hypothetical protein
MRLYLLFSILVLKTFAFAQVTEDFTDGDFSTNPTWTGTTADYIINSSQQLQLNNTIAATSYLSIPHQLTTLNGKEWRFYIKQSFAGSGSNYGRVFLTADNADLTLAQNGYYLQFGEAGSIDAIRLYKLENGTSSVICSGSDGQIVNSITANIRVKRSATGEWSVFADFTGGDSYVLQASGNETSALLGTSFGFLNVYTASNANKFFYDNVYIGDEIFDVAPPILDTVTVISANQIDVKFNEAVTLASSQLIANYSISPTIGITTIVQDGTDPSLMHFTLSGNLVNGTTYSLTATNISDLANNIAASQTLTFQYLVSDIAQKGDVIITEFFPDPSPVIGLPEVEFVEIYNKSTKIFNIQGWKIGDASTDGTIGSAWLLPGEYKVLTATANVPLFTTTTAIQTTSFPSLNNAGDDVVLKDNNGIAVDKLTFTDDWYKDEIKKAGGFTLELINPNNPCSDASNWIASNSTTGGTPGFVNSVNDLTPDTAEPTVDLLLALAPNFLEIHFNEGMDSISLVNATMSFSPTLTIQNRFVQTTFPKVMTVQFNEVLVGSQIYNLTLENISDCSLNESDFTGDFVLPESPEKGDLIINEILQNPKNGGQDWIELYNNSSKVLNLKDWQLANFDDDTIANFKTINDNYLLSPNEYVVIGKDSNFVKMNYPFAAVGTYVYAELPSYNNDSGTVYLIYNQELIDRVSYLDAWHLDLLDDTDGVSLERIDPNGASSSEFNWHSAAESIGFASPGRKNSQYLPALTNGKLSLTSEVISPDNDGFEDILQINYQMSEPGLLAKASIYDDRGRLIRNLFSNELMATSGTFSWDGTTDSQAKASIGVYVLVFEAFSTNGGVFFTDKLAVTVAGKL